MASIPKTGMIVPKMGTNEKTVARSGVGSALFTPVQQRVLGLLFGQPDRRFQSAEIIQLAHSGTGAVHRQLKRLEQAQLVTATREGNQKYYQARKDSAIYSELHRLVVKTVGLVHPLQQALQPLAPHIVAAFVFGSIAKGGDKATSDVDLLVVSDEVTYADLFDALQTAEQQLGRPINPRVLKQAEWERKSSAPDSFTRRIASQPKLMIIGSEDDLT